MGRLGHSRGVALAVVALGVAATAGVAGAVSLDTSFSGDGKVTTPIGPGAGDEDTGYAMAVQDDGKIVVVGSSYRDDLVTTDFAVARFNANGSLDSSFGGGDGKVVTDVSAGLSEEIDEAQSVAIQDDDKIVVAGYAGGPLAYDPGGDFAAVRYNADGTLDSNSDADPGTSFDTDGIAVTDVSGSFEDAAYGVAIQDDGKIVLAGQADVPLDFALVRHNPDGTLDDNSDLDGGFGGDGIVQTNVANTGSIQDDLARALVIQPDDKIVAAGSADFGPDFSNMNFAAVRYLADGSPDGAFSGDGKAVASVGADPTFPWDEANAVALQPDGKLVLAGWAIRAGSSYSDFALVRFTTGGALDSGFSGDGKLTKQVSRIGSTSAANAVVIQGDGRIVAAGRAVSKESDTNPLDYGLARFHANGSADVSFGCAGGYTVAVASNTGRDRLDVATAIALQSDARILAAGSSDTGPFDYADLDFSLVRLNPGGVGEDCDPPQTTLTKGPGKRTRDRTPTFRFRSDEAGSGFQCKRDGKPWNRCSSPKTLPRLSIKRHTFRVRAIDRAGNVDPTPVKRRFKVLRKRRG